jgi:hypothetical protein
VKLAGISLMADHAVIKNTPDAEGKAVITVEPATPGAKVYVNGDVVSGPTVLRHNYRLVFGTSHVFRVVVPAEAPEWKPSEDTPELQTPDQIDYSFALMEMNKGQAKAFGEQEALRRKEAEEERRKADARVAELEERMRAEREAAEKEAAERIKAMEERAKASEGNEELVRVCLCVRVYGGGGSGRCSTYAGLAASTVCLCLFVGASSTRCLPPIFLLCVCRCASSARSRSAWPARRSSGRRSWSGACRSRSRRRR